MGLLRPLAGARSAGPVAALAGWDALRRRLARGAGGSGPGGPGRSRSAARKAASASPSIDRGRTSLGWRTRADSGQRAASTSTMAPRKRPGEQSRSGCPRTPLER
eukprot:1994153-Pyramimonas_sp.AAC.1